jgi:beta-glucanase (GH16 family)
MVCGIVLEGMFIYWP